MYFEPVEGHTTGIRSDRRKRVLFVVFDYFPFLAHRGLHRPQPHYWPTFLSRLILKKFTVRSLPFSNSAVRASTYVGNILRDVEEVEVNK
ncbi:uncharacterized protein PADG_05445 [Paracoccidioides brasiliensis Pb18]|uniref:Uncharacterized protein n=2 Tax=Paracoccidioides brasiliensis TaxID=121759 RepID=C1GDV9_PARBD|nr:uncharacterized protein PADG_05445 [Paracoccidioides brasiliensis Pb18]EEH49366.2 hypothetical protein PADG_05445 [Paracoccidioides brasiliensis Pb18]ODH16259.1 hypothetical protein ACO22_06370 [Paracoccidioides brasiliensis]ODH49804.1 hypothetical protein GX48_04032 [Paracoccidioides brasiliensis]